VKPVHLDTETEEELAESSASARSSARPSPRWRSVSTSRLIYKTMSYAPYRITIDRRSLFRPERGSQGPTANVARALRDLLEHAKRSDFDPDHPALRAAEAALKARQGG